MRCGDAMMDRGKKPEQTGGRSINGSRADRRTGDCGNAAPPHADHTARTPESKTRPSCLAPLSIRKARPAVRIPTQTKYPNTRTRRGSPSRPPPRGRGPCPAATLGRPFDRTALMFLGLDDGTGGQASVWVCFGKGGGWYQKNNNGGKQKGGGHAKR